MKIKKNILPHFIRRQAVVAVQKLHINLDGDKTFSKGAVVGNKRKIKLLYSYTTCFESENKKITLSNGVILKRLSR